MSLHLSVSHSVPRGICLSACWDTSPQEQTPLSPPGADTPPGAVHAGRYGQQAGGTHPTGMHTCSLLALQTMLTFYLHRFPTKFDQTLNFYKTHLKK